MRHFSTFPFWVLSSALLLSCLRAQAQSPTVVSATLSPARNASSVRRNTPVVIPFSQAINPASAGAVTIYSRQYRGQRTATAASAGGTLTLTPTAPAGQAADFKPGETVFVTVPRAVQGSNGAPAAPYVYQFTAATTGGSGSFPTGAEVEVGSIPFIIGPIDATVADVDGDGDLDLLTANYSEVDVYSNTVSVRLNDGSGRFSGTTEVSVGTNPQRVVAGDVDGDGDLDILTANIPLGFDAPGTVSVRLNDSQGHFSGATEVSVGNSPSGIALGDMDGDGDLDIVTTNYRGNIHVRLNDGKGAFSGTVEKQVVYNSLTPLLGDIDGDGDLDVLTPQSGGVFSSQPGIVSILLNDGSGNLANPTMIESGIGTANVALGDVDGDGDLDLLAASAGFQDHYTEGGPPGSGTSSVGSYISVRLNDGQGSFAEASKTTIREDKALVNGLLNMKLGDVDGDGDLDAFTSYNNFTSNAQGYFADDKGSVSVLLNDGSGRFTAITTASTGLSPRGMDLGDLDGDGDLDFVMANAASTSATNAAASTVSVRFNQNSNTLSSSSRAVPEVKLYPNPGSRLVDVRMSLPVSAGITQVGITVYNALGQVVTTGILPVRGGQGAGVLPTAGLAAGIYTVRLQAGTVPISRRLVLE
jgi:hypothetical protein